MLVDVASIVTVVGLLSGEERNSCPLFPKTASHPIKDDQSEMDYNRIEEA